MPHQRESDRHPNPAFDSNYLGDDRADEPVSVAAALAMLQRIAPLATELGPRLPDLAVEVVQVHRAIRAAVDVS